MKIKHAERHVKMFPSMLGLPGEKLVEQELQGFIAILNPIEEKDKIISEQ